MKELIQKSILRTINESDLPLVLKWRNSERIRLVMNNKSIISWEQHLNWFKEIRKCKEQEVFIIELNSKPIGIASFKKEKEKINSCEWGIYVGSPQKGIPLGKVIAFLSLDYIFNKYEIVKASVYKSNIKSNDFHKELSFLMVSSDSTMNYYELTKRSWLQHKENLLR